MGLFSILWSSKAYDVNNSFSQPVIYSYLKRWLFSLLFVSVYSQEKYPFLSSQLSFYAIVSGFMHFEWYSYKILNSFSLLPDFLLNPHDS